MVITIVMGYLAVITLLLGIIILLVSRIRRKKSGIPSGEIIYTDTSGWKALAKPLFDPKLGLTGKPDYLVKQGTNLFPIEVKSSRAPQYPYKGHILQLAAYCHLVSIEFKDRPDFGYIHYKDKTYKIPYSTGLENELTELIADIRGLESQSGVDRSHQSPGRCRGCGYGWICDQKIA